MAETLNVPQMLWAFWHKARCQFVPLTASEWSLRAGITPRQRATIRGRHLVIVDRTLRGGEPVYELSETGLQLLGKSDMLKSVQPLEVNE